MLKKSLDKYARVVRQIDKGVSLKDALKEEKMATATYYSAKKAAKKIERKGVSAKKKLSFIDLEQPASADKVAVVICSVGALRGVLDGVAK